MRDVCAPRPFPPAQKGSGGGSLSRGKGEGSQFGGDREVKRDSRPLLCDTLSHWTSLIILVS